MRTLARAARRPQETGGFMPPVFMGLENAGIRFREGTVSIIAGTPGSMKTGFTLYLVGRWNRPTLYFSADSEDFEMVERAAAMVTGQPTTAVRTDPGKFADALDNLNIRMTFEDSPSYDDFELEIAAYAEVFGDWPKVIVLDNLLNLTGENESEWAAHRDHMRVIHKVARITKAKLLVLAHMGEDKVDPTGAPQPRTKLQGKVSHLPKLIGSLAFDGQRLKFAAVKNRFGPASPSGQNYVEIWCDPATNRFYNSQQDFHAGREA